MRPGFFLRQIVRRKSAPERAYASFVAAIYEVPPVAVKLSS
jgi:hypothetical protein